MSDMLGLFGLGAGISRDLVTGKESIQLEKKDLIKDDAEYANVERMYRTLKAGENPFLEAVTGERLREYRERQALIRRRQSGEGLIARQSAQAKEKSSARFTRGEGTSAQVTEGAQPTRFFQRSEEVLQPRREGRGYEFSLRGPRRGESAEEAVQELINRGVTYVPLTHDELIAGGENSAIFLAQQLSPAQREIFKGLMSGALKFEGVQIALGGRKLSAKEAYQAVTDRFPTELTKELRDIENDIEDAIRKLNQDVRADPDLAMLQEINKDSSRIAEYGVNPNQLVNRGAARKILNSTKAVQDRLDNIKFVKRLHTVGGTLAEVSAMEKAEKRLNRLEMLVGEKLLLRVDQNMVRQVLAPRPKPVLPRDLTKLFTFSTLRTNGVIERGDLLNTVKVSQSPVETQSVYMGIAQQARAIQAECDLLRASDKGFNQDDRWSASTRVALLEAFRKELGLVSMLVPSTPDLSEAARRAEESVRAVVSACAFTPPELAQRAVGIPVTPTRIVGPVDPKTLQTYIEDEGVSLIYADEYSRRPGTVPQRKTGIQSKAEPSIRVPGKGAQVSRKAAEEGRARIIATEMALPVAVRSTAPSTSTFVPKPVPEYTTTTVNVVRNMSKNIDDEKKENLLRQQMQAFANRGLDDETIGEILDKAGVVGARRTKFLDELSKYETAAPRRREIDMEAAAEARRKQFTPRDIAREAAQKAEKAKQPRTSRGAPVMKAFDPLRVPPTQTEKEKKISSRLGPGVTLRIRNKQ